MQDDRFFNISQPLRSTMSKIFPPNVIAAVKQLPSNSNVDLDRVGITMSFPHAKQWGWGEKLDPQMILPIKNSVSYFAWRLFHAHIEESNGKYFLVLENGLKVESNDGIFLRGCRRNAIPKVFGEIVAKAIQTSLAYTQERRADSLTESVVMNIGRMVEDEATIFLSVEEKEGIYLKEALWGK